VACRAEAGGAAGVAERGATGRSVPQIWPERGADVSLEAEPGARTQGVRRDGAEGPGAGAPEAGR